MTQWQQFPPADSAARVPHEQAPPGPPSHASRPGRMEIDHALERQRGTMRPVPLGWLSLLGLVGLLFLGVVLLSMLSGCGDMAHRYTRTVWGVDCRPEKLKNGQCVGTTRTEVR